MSSKTLDFFQQKKEFLRRLPSPQNALPSSNRNDSTLFDLTQNYLDCYRIHFVKAGLAQTHRISKCTINGFDIVEQTWENQANNSTCLYICHGYFDHTGLMRRLIQWGLEQGFTVRSFDLPGHGLSSGEPAAIASFEQYSAILSAIIERDKPKTFSLLGQSTGCAVITGYLLNTHNRMPIHTWLLAPLVRSWGWKYQRFLLPLLKPYLHSIRRAFHPASHDKAFNHFLRYKDPLQAKRIPLCWLAAMDEWSERLKGSKFDANDTARLTIIQGTADTTVDYRHNIKLLSQHFTQTQVRWVSGARHQLMNESEPYWRKVKDQLDATITQSP